MVPPKMTRVRNIFRTAPEKITSNLKEMLVPDVTLSADKTKI